MADGNQQPTPETTSGTPPTPEAKPDIKTETAEMKAVESPPLAPEIAPAQQAPVAEPAMASATAETKPAEAAKPFNFPKMTLPPLRMPKLSRRNRWRGLIAASMAFAAGVGAAIGAITVAPKNPPAAARNALAEERDAMQQTIVKLGKEVSALKSSLDNATKTAATQIAKLNDRIKDGEKSAEHARRASLAPDVTGSIAPPAPIPSPRPQIAEAKPAIVEGWTIRSAREGMVLVEGRGEIFEVVRGAPLPGLGRVEEIKRQDGRWVVVTPKGIIVAARQRSVYDRY